MKAIIAAFLVSFFSVTVVYAKSAGDCRQELKEMCKDKSGRDKFDCMRSGV